MKKRSGCCFGEALALARGPLAVERQAAVAVMIVEQPGEAPAADREADVLLAAGLHFGQAGAKAGEPLADRRHQPQAILGPA